MKKLFLMSALCAAIASPAFATGIDADNTSPDCDNATLGTYVGPTTLKAEWNANTINLKWYDHNGEIQNVQNSSKTCTYADGITLQTAPSRTGYQFSGWQVIVPFDLSTLNASTDGYNYYARCWYDDADYCFAYGEGTVSDDEGAEVCTRDAAGLSDVALHEWKTNFSYGTVKGIARCSTQHPTTFWYDNNNTFTADHFASNITDETGQEGAQYCWCLPTGFDAEKDGTYLPVSSPLWVSYNDGGNADSCAANCAYGCADNVLYYSVFRSAMYGITE